MLWGLWQKTFNEFDNTEFPGSLAKCLLNYQELKLSLSPYDLWLIGSLIYQRNCSELSRNNMDPLAANLKHTKLHLIQLQ